MADPYALFLVLKTKQNQNINLELMNCYAQINSDSTQSTLLEEQRMAKNKDMPQDTVNTKTGWSTGKKALVVGPIVGAVLGAVLGGALVAAATAGSLGIAGSVGLVALGIVGVAILAVLIATAIAIAVGDLSRDHGLKKTKTTKKTTQVKQATLTNWQTAMDGLKAKEDPLNTDIQTVLQTQLVPEQSQKNSNQTQITSMFDTLLSFKLGN
jgi:hypothetical protein